MRSKENLYLKSLLENTFREQFKEDREVYKVRVKNQILRTQKENQRTYNVFDGKSLVNITAGI